MFPMNKYRSSLAAAPYCYLSPIHRYRGWFVGFPFGIGAICPYFNLGGVGKRMLLRHLDDSNSLVWTPHFTQYHPRLKHVTHI